MILPFKTRIYISSLLPQKPKTQPQFSLTNVPKSTTPLLIPAPYRKFKTRNGVYKPPQLANTSLEHMQKKCKCNRRSQFALSPVYFLVLVITKKGEVIIIKRRRRRMLGLMYKKDMQGAMRGMMMMREERKNDNN
jgi:hypothetical protein